MFMRVTFLCSYFEISQEHTNKSKTCKRWLALVFNSAFIED
ncbi:hypothetical protein SME36J_46440 [Serratia marcescens]|nr:hypothetical protein SME36J_46440 [Serratia marcescens]